MDSLNTSRTLTFTGWAQEKSFIDASAFKNLVQYDYLNKKNIAAVKQDFTTNKLVADYDLVIAWSLGGLVASHLVDAKIIKTKVLALIAPPFKFVGDCSKSNMSLQNWNNNVLSPFYRGSKNFVKSFTEGILKQDNKNYIYKEAPYEAEKLLYWLSFLQNEDMKSFDFANFPEVLVFHGKKDKVTNFSQAQVLKIACPKAQIVEFAQAGHAPHTYDWPRVKTTIDIATKNII